MAVNRLGAEVVLPLAFETKGLSDVAPSRGSLGSRTASCRSLIVIVGKVVNQVWLSDPVQSMRAPR